MRAAQIEIPAIMNHLKVDERGYAIPYFAPIVDGKPNFRYQDPSKRKECLERHLCAICGKKLPKDYQYVITGPMGLQNGVVSDAPMHRECAEYSMSVCPHMYYEKAERKTEGTEFSKQYTVQVKPSELFLIKISRYRSKHYPELHTELIHFTVASFEAFIYQDNHLVKK